MDKQLLWNKITRVIMLLAERKGISPRQALHLFYESHTSDALHDPLTGLHLQSDAHIVNNIISER